MDYSDSTSAKASAPTGSGPTGPREPKPAGSPIQDAVKAPARPRGPNASAILAGLVAIFLAGLVIARETMDLRVDWSRLGPGTIVGLGIVMVAIGAIGLVRRRDDS